MPPVRVIADRVAVRVTPRPALQVQHAAAPPVGVIVVRGPVSPGSPGDHAPVVGDPAAGVIDGINTVFTTTRPYRVGTIAVWLNGLREPHFTPGPSSVTFDDAPQPGDTIQFDYFI